MTNFARELDTETGLSEQGNRCKPQSRRRAATLEQPATKRDGPSRIRKDAR